MQLDITLFAAAKDAAGSETIQLDVAEPVRASDVLTAIGDQIPQLTGLLPSCRLAIDCTYVAGDFEISSNANEIALIPPVSGG